MLIRTKQDGREYNPWLAYGQSKTANILVSAALAEKLKNKGVLSFSLQPGCRSLDFTSFPSLRFVRSWKASLIETQVVLDTKLQTNVTAEMFAEGFAIGTAAMDGEPLPALVQKTLEQGASTQVWAAIAPDLEGMSVPYKQNENWNV